MEQRSYVKYSPDLEKIPVGEEEDILAVAKQLTDIQRAQYNVHRHCFSGTHARTQGIVKGKFIVPNDLPQHLKQGELFAKGGEYPLAARYSTEPGDPSLDVSILVCEYIQQDLGSADVALRTVSLHQEALP